MFITLHVKSDCSLGFGTATVDELAETASRAGYGAFALTDVENLYGQVRFRRMCGIHGVRPITGVELWGPARARIILLAKDAAGYRNLCRIISIRRGGAGWKRIEEITAVSLLSEHAGKGIPFRYQRSGGSMLPGLHSITPRRRRENEALTAAAVTAIIPGAPFPAPFTTTAIFLQSRLSGVSMTDGSWGDKGRVKDPRKSPGSGLD